MADRALADREPQSAGCLGELQRADGSWDLTADLARAIGHDLAELEAWLAGATGKKDEARRAWATALALAWLDRVTAKAPSGGSWLDAGARLLTAKSG